MQSHILITVTSAAGRPQFPVTADTTTDQVRQIVKQRYGMHVPQDSWMRPHDFCGQLVPDRSGIRASGHQSSSVPGLLCNPGHLRGI